MFNKRYVYIRDKKTGEIYEYECNKFGNGQWPSRRGGYHAIWNTPHKGCSTGYGFGWYYNLSENEGEIHYNGLWLSKPDLEKAKSLFNRKLDERIERKRQEILRLTEKRV